MRKYFQPSQNSSKNWNEHDTAVAWAFGEQMHRNAVCRGADRTGPGWRIGHCL